MYDYFVAAETQVPAWLETQPSDMETIKMLEEESFRSGYHIRHMLRLLFNSDAFKNARFAKIKGPVEAVIGTLRLIGDWTSSKPSIWDRSSSPHLPLKAVTPAVDRSAVGPWYTALTSLQTSWATLATLAYSGR